MRSVRNFLTTCTLAIAATLIARAETPVDYAQAAWIPHEWNRVIIDVIKVDGFTPASAARNYAYANIAAYEAVRPGFPGYRSLAGQINGFTAPPAPEAGATYDWRVAAIAAYATVLPELVWRIEMIDSAARLQYDRVAAQGVAPDVMERSRAYGEAVGKHVVAWMRKDNFVQMGAKPRYEVPISEGAWERTPPRFYDPVDPYWGTHRLFTMDSVHQYAPADPFPFSTDPNSDFYKQNMEVYELTNKMTDEQFMIARFWDCNPIRSHLHGHFTFNNRQISPGGHWINIAGIAARQKGQDMMASLGTYTLVATAIADAFICSWETKYRTNVMRPVTYIQRYIDSTWNPAIETPPFPEYTSGHSTISAAAAAVLTGIFGEPFEYADDTEAYLGLPVRSFKSFREAAMEVTMSRVYGGIHYMESCIRGTDCGWKIGDHTLRRIKLK